MRKLRITLTMLTLAFLLVISACSSDSPTNGVIYEDTSNSVTDEDTSNSVTDEDISALLLLDAYQNWVPATVEFQGEEYTVYYKIDFWPRIEKGWKDVDINTIYDLRDEATKDILFEVSVWFRDGKERFVDFSWRGEVNPDSFLQRIIVSNTKEEGSEIFFDIVEQIKSQNSDLL